jgi:hypothetical protein
MNRVINYQLINSWGVTSIAKLEAQVGQIANTLSMRD